MLPWKILKIVFFLASLVENSVGKNKDDEDYGILYPSDCEVCKYLTTELEERLKETGKTHQAIETTKFKKSYKDSELRLIESVEEICERMLEYNIHKERQDSTRFAKGMSETFKTLHGLVDKGVKVELGIPYELWDKPSVEITTLKSKCENLVERYEDDIENWYFHHQDIPLKTFLCERKILQKGETGCLTEDLKKKIPQDKKEDKKKDSRKEEKETKKTKEEL